MTEFKQIVRLINSTDPNHDPSVPFDDSWHLVDIINETGDRTLCLGDALDSWESEVKVGRVTCKECLEKIKWYKSIKL